MKFKLDEVGYHNEMKVLFHMSSLMDMIQLGIINPPATLSVDMSNACSHQCYYCIFGEYIASDKTIMSENTMKLLLHDLKDMLSIKAVCLSGGGEPTINKHSDHFMNALFEIGKEVSLNTHGGLLHTKDPNILLKLKYIRVSLDGSNREVYMNTHLPKNKDENEFERVLSNISNLTSLKKSGKIKSDTVIGIGYLMDTKNSVNLFSFVRRLRDEIGVDYIQFRPLKDRDVYQKTKKIFFDQYDELKTLENDNFKIWVTVDKMSEAIMNPEVFESNNMCFVAPLIGNIGPQGDVRVCPELRDHTGTRGYLGNIHDKPFSKIWGSEEHKKHLANMQFRDCFMCKYKGSNELIYQTLVKKDIFHRNFI